MAQVRTHARQASPGSPVAGSQRRSRRPRADRMPSPPCRRHIPLHSTMRSRSKAVARGGLTVRQWQRARPTRGTARSSAQQQVRHISAGNHQQASNAPARTRSSVRTLPAMGCPIGSIITETSSRKISVRPQCARQDIGPRAKAIALTGRRSAAQFCRVTRS